MKYKVGDHVVIQSDSYPSNRNNDFYDDEQSYHYYQNGDFCVVEEVVCDHRDDEELNEYLVRRLNKTDSGYETQYVYAFHINAAMKHFNNLKAKILLTADY